MLKTHYVAKVYLTGIRMESPPPSPEEGEEPRRDPLHWRLTIECRTKVKTESSKAASSSKSHKKGESSKSHGHGHGHGHGHSSKSKATKDKADDKPKIIFIAVDTKLFPSDIVANGGKSNVPAQML